jgi:hypothetical protein
MAYQLLNDLCMDNLTGAISLHCELAKTIDMTGDAACTFHKDFGEIDVDIQLIVVNGTDLIAQGITVDPAVLRAELADDFRGFEPVFNRIRIHIRLIQNPV